MDAAFYHRKAQDAQREVAKLQEDKARCSRDISDASKRISTIRQSMSRTLSGSMRASKERDIEREEQKKTTGQKKIADLDSKIAQAQQKQADAQRNAQREEVKAAEKQQKEAVLAAEDRRRQEERQRHAQAQRDREVSSTLARHEDLHEATRMDIETLRRLPEKIVVLVLAANPIDESSLRLDEEVRLITTEIRASEFRDVIRLESRWAVRPLDLLQALNELKPSIVHFSGHGTEDGQLVFQGDNNTVKFVSLHAIVATMQAAEGVQLVFLNACFSAAQAQAVVQHVPAAIGMTDAIDDIAARIFAAKFYSALGFGHSVERAYLQAQAALTLEGMSNEDFSFLVTAPGVDPAQLVLVRPPNVPPQSNTSGGFSDG